MHALPGYVAQNFREVLIRGDVARISDLFPYSVEFHRFYSVMVAFRE